MAVTLPKAPAVDRESLRDAIRDEYKTVAQDPDQGFHFHTGRRLAGILGYDKSLLDGVPERAIESFAGTGNPFSLGALKPGRARRGCRKRRRHRQPHCHAHGRSGRSRGGHRHDRAHARESDGREKRIRPR